MTTGSFRFGDFCLDPDDRQLCRGDAPVELNARYLDALALLVREQGRLVSKDRFLDEVWRGVPVTDEALTQCIKTLRRQLGDNAGRPRFIETVPKHGYRFIASVEWVEHRRAQAGPLPGLTARRRSAWRDVWLLAGAGTLGGGMAGIIGGLFYGFAGASQPLSPGIGMGAASVLLVLVILTAITALAGAAGVALGIALASRASAPSPLWWIAGGAAGGLVVGAFVKLLGVDALNLLFGHAPSDITGAAEGVLLGGAVGFGAWLADRGPRRLSLRNAVLAAGVAGGAAGVSIPLLGGRLFGGSLDLLARGFPTSRLRLDRIGAALGEDGFGTTSQLVTGALEGMLFGACVVGAMVLARRTLIEPPPPGAGLARGRGQS